MRKNVRSSSTNTSGTSSDAKCPPRSRSLFQWRRSLNRRLGPGSRQRCDLLGEQGNAGRHDAPGPCRGAAGSSPSRCAPTTHRRGEPVHRRRCPAAGPDRPPTPRRRRGRSTPRTCRRSRPVARPGSPPARSRRTAAGSTGSRSSPTHGCGTPPGAPDSSSPSPSPAHRRPPGRAAASGGCRRVRRVRAAQGGGDERTPVPALRAVAGVPEAGHQLCPRAGDAFDVPAAARRLCRCTRSRAASGR